MCLLGSRQLKKLPKFFGDGINSGPTFNDGKFLINKRHVNPYYPQPNKLKFVEITMRSSLGGGFVLVVNGVTDITMDADLKKLVRIRKAKDVKFRK